MSEARRWHGGRQRSLSAVFGIAVLFGVAGVVAVPPFESRAAGSTARLVATTPSKGAVAPSSRPTLRSRRDACILSENDRRYLQRNDGTYLYVEPSYLSRDGEATVLAGQPTYVWQLDAEERGTLVEERSFFGAIARGDSIELIPLPPVEPRRIGWVRGVRVGPGHHVFAFELERASIDPDTMQGPVGMGAVLHVGEVVEGAWRNVQTLDSPGSVALGPLSWGSRLLYRPDSRTVTIALQHTDSRGLFGVVLFDHEDGVWSRREPLVLDALTVDLRRGPGGGDELLVRSPHITMEGGESVVWYRFESDEARILATTGPDERLEAVRWSGAPDTGHAGWMVIGPDGPTSWGVDVDARSDGRTADTAPVVIDADPAQLFPVHGEADGAAAWLTHSSVGASQYLRMVRLDQHDTSGTTEYPFVGPLVALHQEDGDILVAGPDARFDPVAPHVRSLLIDFSYDCS